MCSCLECFAEFSRVFSFVPFFSSGRNTLPYITVRQMVVRIVCVFIQMLG